MVKKCSRNRKMVKKCSRNRKYAGNATVAPRPGRSGPAAHPATALVLPHHGRRNAATAELLQRVRPRAVLVSNKNGEPLPDAASAASGLGLPVYATGSLGTIKLEGGAPLQLTSARPLRL